MKDNNFDVKIILAYFSGTGCTERVCDCFYEQLYELNIEVEKINIAKSESFEIGKNNLLVILSPVYGFRLASITEKWLQRLPINKDGLAAIIAVSGGGEVSPNTACRFKSKKILKNKGYEIVHENMIVMPSNFAFQAEEDLNFDLIRILPIKVKNIISEILSNERRQIIPKFQDRLFFIMGIGEHLGARFFGLSIKASDACTKCKTCVNNCPQKNIKMVNGKLKFGFKCIWCLKCIYSCPVKALRPRILKFTVLKNGFDLKKMIEISNSESFNSEKKYKDNSLWQGVIDYLRKNK